MNISGNIYKMSTKLNGCKSIPNVEYSLPIGEELISLNGLINNFSSSILVDNPYTLVGTNGGMSVINFIIGFFPFKMNFIRINYD